jgi:hypothetical protein
MHEQEASHFRSREPIYDVIRTSRGEAVVEVYPVYAGIRQVRGGPLDIAVEVAMPLSAADKAVEYQPAQEVGGDFYDTLNTGRGLAFVIGDVSGKGIPAALLMV